MCIENMPDLLGMKLDEARKIIWEMEDYMPIIIKETRSKRQEFSNLVEAQVIRQNIVDGEIQLVVGYFDK